MAIMEASGEDFRQRADNNHRNRRLGRRDRGLRRTMPTLSTSPAICRSNTSPCTIDLTHQLLYRSRGSFWSRPKGPKSSSTTVLPERDATADAGIAWTFGIEALRGELSAGTWTLKINDVVGGDGGILNDMKLDVFGTAPSNDDTYHFTRRICPVGGSRPIPVDPDRQRWRHRLVRRLDAVEGGEDRPQ